MKKEYSKPELIDLNEQTGYGRGCVSGSGNVIGCFNGNAAGRECTTGAGATPT